MEITGDRGAFGALPAEFCQYATASIAILPVPYDGTATWMKGSNRGPEALLKASAQMELYDIETDSEVYKRGIVTMDPVDCPEAPEDLVSAVCDAARTLTKDGKFVVGIGGEHTIAVGLARAAAEHGNLTVVQFDAHADTRPSYEGSPYNHACVMARIGEIVPFVQVGIRSMDAAELVNLNRKRTVFAHDIAKGRNVIPRILEALTDQVYLTIDLDVLDPSIMPSTGTPEPGGLDWYGLLTIIESIVEHRRVVGMDVTELLPNPANKAPDFLAAKLIYRVLSMIFAKRTS